MSPHNQRLTSATNLLERLDSDETNAEEIGARITNLRHDKGLSLSELASIATVSKSYLSTVEKGSGSRPGAAFLHKIAQALGVTLADLVGRELVADSPGIPAALQELASERNLPARDVEMLAGIAFVVKPPRKRGSDGSSSTTRSRAAPQWIQTSSSSRPDHLNPIRARVLVRHEPASARYLAGAGSFIGATSAKIRSAAAGRTSVRSNSLTRASFDLALR